jgi:ABC-2 type transport system ATP-binding protein
VLVTTHYMDEAERCHRLAFIFRGELLAVGEPDEVVASRGLAVIEVELEQALRAAEHLRALPEVDAVSHYGRMLRVALRGAGDPQEFVRRELARAEIEPLGLTMGRPTVEDAFVSMVREDEGKRAQQERAA